jgi:ribulose-phosphate 3-epimerase
MKLAPSLLAADFGRLLDQALTVADLSDYLHWDVMDGHFVPNLTFGPVVVNALRERVSTPFDIHLMITDPQKYAPHFRVRAGGSHLVSHRSCLRPCARDRDDSQDGVRGRGSRCGPRRP